MLYVETLLLLMYYINRYFRHILLLIILYICRCVYIHIHTNTHTQTHIFIALHKPSVMCIYIYTYTPICRVYIIMPWNWLIILCIYTWVFYCTSAIFIKEFMKKKFKFTCFYTLQHLPGTWQPHKFCCTKYNYFLVFLITKDEDNLMVHLFPWNFHFQTVEVFVMRAC
jgi:mRNA-degrading endonuclease YafQ of YafQ-DinJ toxin-antitoxin module